MGAIREIKLSGHNNYSTIVDEEDYQTLKLWDYRLSRTMGRNTSYVQTYKNGKRGSLHRLIMGLENAPRSVLVDHIDGNGLNNYRTNLRVTNNIGNARNQQKRISAQTSSTYKGVSKCSNNKSNPWEASIGLSGKKKYLGTYRTEIEAGRAYNKAALELFGPMALLNEL